MFIEYQSVEPIDNDENQYIRTGFRKLDARVMGIQRGAVTVITGLAGCGKSTFLGNLICEFCTQEQMGLVCSFEMSNARFQSWLDVQVLGKDYIDFTRSASGKNIYSPKTRKLQDLAESFISKYVRLYDNRDFRIQSILDDIKSEIAVGHQVDYIMIDNLMKIDYNGEKDKYLSQSSLIKEFQTIAQEYNIAVIVVAHPKKINTLLRIDDIGGSGDIVNVADLVLILHKITQDFKIKAHEYFGWDIHNKNKSVAAYNNNYHLLIEIVKSREFGEEEGKMMGAYYDPVTRRLLNSQSENRHYFMIRKSDLN